LRSLPGGLQGARQEFGKGWGELGEKGAHLKLYCSRASQITEMLTHVGEVRDWTEDKRSLEKGRLEGRAYEIRPKGVVLLSKRARGKGVIRARRGREREALNEKGRKRALCQHWGRGGVFPKGDP